MVRLVSSSDVSPAKAVSMSRPLESVVVFSRPAGIAVFDDSGVFYFYRDRMYTDRNASCPETFWGRYPFYFPRTTVPTKVTITNSGPSTNYTLITEIYFVSSNGTYQKSLVTPHCYTFEVPEGETALVNASFMLPDTLESIAGTNRFTFSVYRHKRTVEEVSLTRMRDGIVCPVSYFDRLQACG